MPKQKNNSASITEPKTKPETQALFDMFIINGMELLYDEKQAKSMLPRIGVNEDPTKVIAEILVDIIMRVITSAKSAGKIIPPEVVLHGGNVLFAELLKVLEAAGMEILNEEQKTAVWQTATSLYLDQALKSGQITEQELIAYSKQSEQTAIGKKIMKTTENPEVTSAQSMPPEQGQVIPDGGIAAPQGGI